VTLDTNAAVAAIRKLSRQVPTVAIVLGSGLGALADEVEDADRIPYEKIPGWKRSTAPGHAGQLVIGQLAGKTVAVMKGRLHYYEGHDMEDVVFPIRVFKAWGIDTLILTNACGGLNPSYKAGDLMVLNDHINLFFATNPLRGPNDDTLGPRFPDMVGTYTEELRRIAHAVDPDMREGIYVGVAGPNYETPAELRMMRRLGADAVGMSTVPEILVARHMGMRILAIATVTDMATGLPGLVDHVSHEEVLAVADRVGKRLGNVVKGVLGKL
jgi:purine-nucleoside phosphorylase